MKYTKEEIEEFKDEICPRCILKGRCIWEKKDDEWFSMCPHYFNWKIGYVSPLIARSERADAERQADPEAYDKKMDEYIEKCNKAKKLQKIVKK